MNKTLVAISRFSPLRATFRAMRLHRIYNKWLECFPRTRVLPGSGVTYRARRTEAVSLALEILEGGNVYDESLMPDDCTTVVDLGCNIGYFSILMAHHTKNHVLRGIMVDANPDVLVDARWHAQKNNWKDMHILQGVCGVEANTGSAEFLVHEANTVSTAYLAGQMLEHKDQYKSIQTPVISVGKEWKERMGNTRCNILKLDIEGCELIFLQQEVEFLKLVDAMYVECHEPRVSFEALTAYLAVQNFKLVKIVEHVGNDVLGFYKRVDPARPKAASELKAQAV